MGFASGIAGPSRDLLVKKSAPDNATGRVYGVVYSGLDIGQALAPLFFGALMDHQQYRGVWLGLVFMQAVLITSAFQMRRVRRVRQTTAPRSRLSCAETSVMQRARQIGAKRSYPSGMYAAYFGLKHEPFSIAPDPRYLFMSERHREALAHLVYGVGGGGGFVLLSGEIGTGKTTVCRLFLEQIPANCNVAYIFNPKLTATELLQSICDEFHIPVARKELSLPTVKDYLDPLNEFLLEAHAAGRNSLLIIDEAQNLSAEVLEQLRLLTNLETSERKLLQIVLIGQPELRTMLAQARTRATGTARHRTLSPGCPESGGNAGVHRAPPGDRGPGAAVTVRAQGCAAHSPAVARRAAAHQPAVRPRAARRFRQFGGRGRSGDGGEGGGRSIRRAGGSAVGAAPDRGGAGFGPGGGCGLVRCGHHVVQAGCRARCRRQPKPATVTAAPPQAPASMAVPPRFRA